MTFSFSDHMDAHDGHDTGLRLRDILYFLKTYKTLAVKDTYIQGDNFYRIIFG